MNGHFRGRAPLKLLLAVLLVVVLGFAMQSSLLIYGARTASVQCEELQQLRAELGRPRTLRVQIVGERHSGTTWLTHLLKVRLCVTVVDTEWKHGYFSKASAAMTETEAFVRIVQSPYAWFLAMYEHPIETHRSEGWRNRLTFPAYLRSPYLDAPWVRSYPTECDSWRSPYQDSLVEPPPCRRVENIVVLRTALLRSYAELVAHAPIFVGVRYEDLLSTEMGRESEAALRELALELGLGGHLTPRGSEAAHFRHGAPIMRYDPRAFLFAATPTYGISEERLRYREQHEYLCAYRDADFANVNALLDRDLEAAAGYDLEWGRSAEASGGGDEQPPFAHGCDDAGFWEAVRARCFSP
jgi:hypothetical protein